MSYTTTHLERALGRQRGNAAAAQARTERTPRTERTAPSLVHKPHSGGVGPRGKAPGRPPELGTAVVLDCDPPVRGIVERVDLNRGLAYVRTAYGTLAYGFAEIKRRRG